MQELESKVETVSSDYLLLVHEVLALRAGFEAHSSVLAAMGINMAGTAQYLPMGIKTDCPKGFNGKMDGNTIRAFLFSVEQYFQLGGITADN